MTVAFSPAVDAWATAAAAQVNREEASFVEEALAAAAAGVFAVILADRMFDIAEEAIDLEYEIRDRIFEIQNKYIDHYTGVTVPQAQLVCGVTYGLAAPGANYGGTLNLVNQQAVAIGAGAEGGIDSLNIRNRADCGQRDCTNDAQMAAPIAAVQASHYLYRHAERRRYDLDDEYRRFAAGTFRGLETKPDQVFSLLGNAASLYGTIGQAANSAGSSAASVAGGFFGYAAGALS